MIQRHQSPQLSAYADLYDVVVPKDHKLRKMNDLIDFSFVYEELEDTYSLNYGRTAIDPIQLFKYLLLKSIYPLSDVDLVERSKYDMSFKYFLGMAPEESVINPSTLTKFRKMRLKDVHMLDLLIEKTVEIALDKGVIQSKTGIVDTTHTRSRYNQKSPEDLLRDRSKQVLKAVYAIDETLKSSFPDKPTTNGLQTEIDDSEALITVIDQNEVLQAYPKVTEPLNLLRETVKDDLKHLQSIHDPDARVGHKSADPSFFGYKTHLAMSEERIITAAVVTTGEKNDGPYLQTLIENSQKAGMNVDTVIGDTAYSGKDNLTYTTKEEIALIAKLHPSISQGTRAKEDEFTFNKDAGMYVCKAGHLAYRKAKNVRTDKNRNPRNRYFFDIEKCQRCPFQEGCYKAGAKSKTYTETMKSDEHAAQMAFQETELFKERAKERYKIEAKNSELKHRHGYEKATSSGLLSLELQGAMAIFTVNIKRILKLMGE